MISVTKRFSFDAAHKLPNHNGKCKNLHGHHYICELTFTNGSGEPICDNNHPSDGMIVDFGVISQLIIAPIREALDHHFLNEILKNPTAEILAGYIAYFTKTILNSEKFYINLQKVKLWETPDSYATWKNPEQGGIK